MDAEKRSTLKWMFGVAVFIDVVQIILDLLVVGVVVDTLITVIAAIIFYIWLSIRGMKTPELSVKLIRIIIGESVPVVNFIPMWSRFFWVIMKEEAKKAAGPLAQLAPTK